MDTLFGITDTLFLRLAWAAAQATVLIGALWLIGRCVPRMSPAIRCMLWWLVAAQLLLGMLISTPIELHWLPAAQHAATVVTHEVMPAGGTATARTNAASFTTYTDTTASASAWSWPQAMVALWLLAVLLQGLFAIRQWRENRALTRDSQPLRDAALQLVCAEQAHNLGLRHVPHLRMSDAIVSPQVTGWWRPLVLLPTQHALSSEELSMALGHELAHLRRGDLWLGWVPAIAQRLFFFHPLVTWAMREYAVYREAACDAQVLQRQHAAPQSYGHLLLRLGVAHPPHAGLAGASSTFQNLKRRLVLLQHGVNDATPRAYAWLLVAMVGVIGILPYRVTATSAMQSAADIPAPPAPPTPPATPAAPLPPAAALPAPPAPPAAPALPAGYAYGYSSAHRVDIDTHAGATHGIAIFDGDTIMINGSDTDVAEAQRLHKGNNPLLWFRRGDKAYVVHNEDMIREVKDAYTPITELAQDMGKLAGKQGELAGRQSGIAARQSVLAGREAEIASRRASMEAQRASAQAAQDAVLAAGVTGQLAGMTAEEAEIQRENKQLQQQAAELSQHAAELSKQQAAMSSQQAAASQRAEQQMDKVLDRALAQGLAEPINR